MSAEPTSIKREHDSDLAQLDQPKIKVPKTDPQPSEENLASLRHGKGRMIPRGVLSKLSLEDVDLIENVKSNCTDLERVKAAIQLRRKHRLCVRLPEDFDDSSYYIEKGLRRVYPYQYLYQSYTKKRWIGRKFKDVLKEEFRDIPDDQLTWRFDQQRILVNGEPIDYNYVLQDNDFVSNITHRHELAVLATPIKFIYRDKNIVVIDKPPSVPIHPCGRYRHNSVTGILYKQYGIKDIKVVHRLDRLVSGVLMLALNSTRANQLEKAIQNRDVQKEYVCRVVGEFPLGKAEDDGEITVDQPLETIPGKIGLTVAIPEGKPSLTTFKRLNYNGKTSAVLCKPKTGRMHQIRVHLQYLGYPIANDTLYNCDAFGPERGKGGRYGKSIKQIPVDVVAMHRAHTWLINEENLEPLGNVKIEEQTTTGTNPELDEKVRDFISEEERKETMAALEHFFSDESWKDLEEKYRLDEKKLIKEPTCRDCNDKYHDPPLRNLFLYLHALKYSGDNWCYESELPNWAKDSWQY